MTGNKLEEIERAYVELFAGKKRLPKCAKLAREALAHDVSAALMQWQFDLGTLKPDRGLPVIDRLRTPIAWMANGITGIRGESPESSPPQSPSTNYPDEEYPAEEEYPEEQSPPQSSSDDYPDKESRPLWIQSSDFHEIMPRQMSCYDCRTSIIDLPVTAFQQEAREEDVQETLPADKPVARKVRDGGTFVTAATLPTSTSPTMMARQSLLQDQRSPNVLHQQRERQARC